MNFYIFRMNSLTKLSRADLIGIINSSVCLVHCIGTPLLIAFGASFLMFPIFKYLFLIVSFASIYQATKFSKRSKITLLLWASFWGFLFSTLFQEEYEWLHYLGYFFSILIIVGHILNIRFCKNCSNHKK